VTAAQGGLQVGRTILNTGQIRHTVERLAATIARDYRGKPLLLLAVLKGALCFAVDLARALGGRADGPSEIVMDYICLQRYGTRGSAGGPVRLAKDCAFSVSGAHVLVLDGIVDSGLTLEFLQTLLRQRGPASLRSCALLDRPAGRQVEASLDYVGEAVGDGFVIGYGLDYKELYRNLPYLAELREG